MSRWLGVVETCDLQEERDDKGGLVSEALNSLMLHKEYAFSFHFRKYK